MEPQTKPALASAEVDSLHTRITAISEELLAALDDESRINGATEKNSEEIRAAWLKTDRLAEEYGRAIEECRDAMRRAFPLRTTPKAQANSAP